MFFQKIRNGYNEWWRYFAGATLIFIGWQTVAMLPVFALMTYIVVKGGKMGLNILQAAKDAGVDENITLLALLSSFALACIGVYVAVKYLHKRSFLSLVTARPKFSWKRAIIGFSLWFAYVFIMLGIGYSDAPEDFVFSFDPMKFLPLLIISVVLLPFQIGFEEFYFRGYLTQAVGIVTGSRILAILLPGIAFGLLHAFNPEVFAHGFWVMMPFYIGMGIFFGIVAVMDDGLELPLGIHFANNLSGAVLVGVANSALPTTPLFTVVNYNPVDEILPSVLTMVVFVFLFSFLFQWNWRKLFQKIER